MNDTEKILAAISEVNDKIDGIDKRVEAVEARVEEYEKTTARRIERQQANIESLRCKIEELAHSNAAVWKSRDELEIGIDRNTAYDAFRELGIRRREALKTLEALGILVREPDNLTKHVRLPDNSYIRAVVVLDNFE